MEDMNSMWVHESASNCVRPRLCKGTKLKSTNKPNCVHSIHYSSVCCIVSLNVTAELERHFVPAKASLSGMYRRQEAFQEASQTVRFLAQSLSSMTNASSTLAPGALLAARLSCRFEAGVVASSSSYPPTPRSWPRKYCIGY